ncbi:uncharacterized protein YggU (UPF0235/DUF167 family) [Labrys wisconsinensis]|uniref:UPF0235 protein QO011_004102 n=1 Tax=Labrys wisconsinensis TaxID=425677 RepID=A0ABU0J9Z4_9HYPH|nr:uncharacterized protein YggU (UPF0235/DUF167 family) [Labrys wisconsinensis]
MDVRLTPRGGRDAVDGVETLADGRRVLAARVRAAPTGGEANAALVALVAKALKLPKSRVAVASGATSRVKSLAIEGEGAVLAEALRQIVFSGEPLSRPG